MKKRLLAILLAAAMVVGLCPAETMAADGSETSEEYTSRVGVKAVSLGRFHSAAITEDGNLWTWGHNSLGSLGNEDLGKEGTDCDHPSRVLKDKKVKAISLGEYHSAAITEDGRLLTWGDNRWGELGDGTHDSGSSPREPMEVRVKAVSLGSYFSAAITENGELWTWGSNGSGQLGDKAVKSSSSVPVRVPEISRVTAVSLGHQHSAAITEDGALWTWGSNDYGQLGDGTKEPKDTPAKVEKLGAVKAVSLGNNFSAAITEDGALWMWGDNSRGQLGDGTTEQRSTPVPVKGIEKVKAVSLGEYHSAAVTEDGKLYTWGWNHYGQLGDKTNTDSHHPTEIEIGEPVADVCLGNRYSAAITEGGRLYVWGYNGNGNLGDWTKEHRTEPVQIMGPNDSSYKPAEEVIKNLKQLDSSVQLFKAASGSVGDKPITKAFPGDYSVDISPVNITHSCETVGNGLYKIKIALGIDFEKHEDDEKKDGDDEKKDEDLNEILNSPSKWVQYCYNIKKLKEQITGKEDEKAKKGIADFSRYIARTKDYSVQTDSFPLTNPEMHGFKRQPTVSIIGYVEIYINENAKYLTSDSAVIMSAQWNAKTGRQAVIGALPVYVDLEGSMEVGAGLEVEYEDKLNPKGIVTLTPCIAPEAGIGVYQAITVGLKGSAELNAQLLPESRGDLTAGIAVTGCLLFIGETEHEIASGTYELWPHSASDDLIQPPLKGSASALAADDEEPDFTLVSRDYQDKTSEWNGSVGDKKLRGADGNGLTIAELQSYIMPNTLPQMKTIGGDTVMVFQATDAGRAAQNSVKLMYSVYDGNSWSEPKALWDNGTLDTFADLEQIGNDLYVVWQKCREKNKSSDADAALAEATKSSEICYSKYDASTKTFGEAAYITDNSTLDMMPCFVKGSAVPAVVWINSPDNDLTGMGGKKTVKVSELRGGKWSEPEILGSTDDYVSELDGIYADGTYKAALLHTDAKSNPKLDLAFGGNLTTLVSGDEAVMSGLRCQPGEVTYTEDGIVKKYSLAGGSVSEIRAGESENISSNVVNVSQGDKNALLWMSNDEEGCHFYASVEGDGGYSEPAEIYRDEKVDGRYFTAAIDSDGNWQIVYSADDKDDGDRTSMYFVTKEMAPKAELGSVLINEMEMDGMTQPISYTVTNNGEEPVTSLRLTVTDAGQTLLSKNIACNIQPGETQYFEDEVELKSTSETQKLTVSAVAGGQLDTEGTSLTEKIGLSDFSLDVKKQVKSDGAEFKAIVTNTGRVTSGGSVSFYGDKDGKRKLAEQSFAPIAPGGTAELTFAYNAADMQYTDDTSMYCMMKAETGTEEYCETNNTWYGVTYLWELPEDAQNLVKYAVTPAGLAKKKAAATSIKLSWKETGGASGYEVYRRAYGGKTFKKVKTITKGSITSFTNTKLTAGQYYQYRIRAYKTVNGKPVYSSYSKILTVSTALPAPTLSKAASPKKKQAKVAWKKVKGATGYQVYRASSKKGKYKKVATVKSTKLSCTDKKVSSKKKYYYKVRAYRTAGKKTVYSGWSKVRSARIK